MATPDASTPLPAYARPAGDGLDLRLKVVPGASRACFAGVLGDRLKIRVAEPPEDGKANRAVLALVSAWLAGAPVELVSGQRTPLKTVRVHGVNILPPPPDR